jgi:citrate synthase
MVSYLTSREAAERLGVKPATLYAYVARGILRSELVGPGRARRYSARAVEALVERRRALRDPEGTAQRALYWGPPVLRTSVSHVDGTRLYYRGIDACDLAEHSTFEQVAELLWTGTRPDRLPMWHASHTESLPVFPSCWPSCWPSCSSILPRLLATVPLIGVQDAQRADTSAEHVMHAGRRVVVGLLDGLGAARGEGPVAARLTTALGARATRDAVRLVDRALVLSAEHELNASSFAARVAASAGADPYAVATAAMATLTGTRHGGLSARVEALLDEGETPAAIVARAARGQAIPGFGHPLYPKGDPRVPPLLAAARALGGARVRKLDALLAVVDAMAKRRRERPTLDVALVAVAHALALPAGSPGAIFAVGRVAGWIAHALEQYASDAIIRPRARYVQPRPEEGT